MPRIPLQTVDFYDNSGGLDLKSSPTKVATDASTSTLNVEYDTDGAVRKRFGSTLENDLAQIIADPNVLAIQDYKKSDGTDLQIIAAGTNLYQDIISPVAYSGLTITSENRPDFEYQTTLDDEYLFWGNGVDRPLKFNGTDWTFWSIEAPSGVPTVATGAAGVLVAATYDYYVTFARYDATLGVREQESDLFRSNAPTFDFPMGGPPPRVQYATVVNAGSLQNDLSNIPTSTDPQVNARVIYRRIRAPGGSNDFRFLAVIPNNTATTYSDNDPTDTSELASFAQQNVPITGIFEEYGGRMFVVDAEKSTDVLYSPPNQPWYLPPENILLFDGPVQCIKRIYGALLFGTDRSIWIVLGDILENSPRRISSKVGILNNWCAVGEDTIYILATNKKFYGLKPTDFQDDEIRVDAPLSRLIDPLLNTIQKNRLNQVYMQDYSKGDVSKIIIAASIGRPYNNLLVIFNETQSLAKQKPVWHVWDNINYNTLSEMTILGATALYAGTQDGYIWKLDVQGMDGDGAEINGTATSGSTTQIGQLFASGTATSATADTLTDTGAAWTTNQFIGSYVTIVGGTGAGQTQRIQSNTATTITIIGTWTTTPDGTSSYEFGEFNPGTLAGIKVFIDSGVNIGKSSVITANTNTTLTVSPAFPAPIVAGVIFSVGGFQAYHYSNWKNVVNTYDALKTLWHWMGNLNVAGTYTVDLIIQFDFNITEANSVRIPLTLSATGAIWNTVNWNEFYWNAVSVFQQRIRQAGRFRAIRIGFQNNRAGQPFQVNGFSITCQDKGYLFQTA